MTASDPIHFVGIDIAYFVATVLFVLGLRYMSSPTRARGSIWYAGAGMAIAIFATLLLEDDSGRRVLIPIAMLLCLYYSFHHTGMLMLLLSVFIAAFA